MPLIAALTPLEHAVSHTDEIIEPVQYDIPADLVGITAPTPSALHAYGLAREFRRRGVPVVIGGPHATAIPEEAARHADGVVIGEAEDTWPHVLDDARRQPRSALGLDQGTPLRKVGDDCHARLSPPLRLLLNSAPLRAGDRPLPTR